MNQRGSVPVYLLFSLAASIAVGIGAYVWMRDHRSAEASTEDRPRDVAAPNPVHHEAAPTPSPQPEPEVEPTPPVEVPPSLAEQRAEDPIVDPNVRVSPIFGLPGIDGAIERGSVDRRFKARARQLQQCWDRSSSDEGTVHIALAIAPNGHIDEVAFSDGWNESFRTCVTPLMNAMSFSGTRDGKPVKVVQPVAFQYID